MTELRSLAHVRTGDKGDTCQISVTAFDPKDYPRLLSELTSERVADHFGAFANGPVQRFALPRLHALMFVLERALHSGVTRSLSLDAHGKCIGSYRDGTLVITTLTQRPPPPLVQTSPLKREHNAQQRKGSVAGRIRSTASIAGGCKATAGRGAQKHRARSRFADE